MSSPLGKVHDLLFADATSSLEDAAFSIIGAPIDVSCCHRRGSRFAPQTIRDELGPEQMFIMTEMGHGIKEKVREVTLAHARPVLIGGDHSITSHAVDVIHRIEPISVVILDAHLDYRSNYLGTEMSHACTTRRVSELVGASNVVPIGIRSCSKSEFQEAKENELHYFTMSHIRDNGPKAIIEEALALIGDPMRHRLYLSIDMDVVDPAYAPGVGTPEPFGMSPLELMEVVTIMAPYLIGFDVVEVCPPYDNGNTSSLAAKIVRDIIALISLNPRSP